MKAQESDLFKLMDGAKHWVVPHYQRLYSWEEKHVNKLFSDIEYLAIHASEDRHFIGSIVYVSHPANAGGISEFTVIDGQQRLTTLSLLVLALIQVLGDEDASRSKRLNRFIRNHDESSDSRDYYKLELTRTDDSAFRALINDVALGQTPPEPTERIGRNFRRLVDQINASQASPESLYQALANLDLVEIRLEADSDDPQAIFESLNSTGKDLGPTDLIRNFLLMDQSSEDQKVLYDNYWAKIEVLFKEQKPQEFEEFTRTYLALVNKKYSLKVDTYDDFKRLTAASQQQGQSKIQIVSNYQAGANAYSQLQWSDAPDKKLQRALEDYRALRLRVLHPLLMQFVPETKDIAGNEALTRAVRAVESYAVRRIFCQLGGNAFDKTVETAFEYASKSKRDGVAALEDALLSLTGTARFPRDEELIFKGATLDLYNAKAKEHILRRLEQFLDKNALGLNAKLSVEHVLPQKLSPAWRQILGGKQEAEQIQQRWGDTIGNLTLTPHNSELGNRPYTEKRDLPTVGFAESKIKLSESILKFADGDFWGATEIEKRGHYLMGVVAKVWPMPTIFDDNYKRLAVSIKKDQIGVVELIVDNLLDVETELYWLRPQSGAIHQARLTEEGELVCEGETYSSPSAACGHFTDSSYTGWKEWRVGSVDGLTLDELRTQHWESLQG